MLSPHTPPGTHVECINADECDPNHLKPKYRDNYRECLKQSADYRLGDRLVVSSIQQEELAVDDFSVSFVGSDGRYPLTCFRVLNLPTLLTELLVSEPELV